MFRCLVAAGADLEMRMGCLGYTALQLAVFLHDVDMVRILVEAGADVNAKADGRTVKDMSSCPLPERFFEGSNPIPVCPLHLVSRS